MKNPERTEKMGANARRSRAQEQNPDPWPPTPSPGARSASAILKNQSPAMHIRKQRLLTPGPTPLYPPALHAMMAADIHHRTEDFRKVYRSTLADLKEVMGT